MNSSGIPPPRLAIWPQVREPHFSIFITRMCRWVVYKGRRICLADIITRPRSETFSGLFFAVDPYSVLNRLRHSLVKMSFEHYMPHIESNWNLSKLNSIKHRNHDVNADGFGIGWYDRDVDNDPCIFSRHV